MTLLGYVLLVMFSSKSSSLLLVFKILVIISTTTLIYFQGKPNINVTNVEWSIIWEVRWRDIWRTSANIMSRSDVSTAESLWWNSTGKITWRKVILKFTTRRKTNNCDGHCSIEFFYAFFLTLIKATESNLWTNSKNWLSIRSGKQCKLSRPASTNKWIYSRLLNRALWQLFSL